MDRLPEGRKLFLKEKRQDVDPLLSIDKFCKNNVISICKLLTFKKILRTKNDYSLHLYHFKTYAERFEWF